MLNPTSLCKVNAVQQLSVDLNNFGIHVAFISETWFKSHICDSCVTPENYNLVRRDREHKKGGGVCMYINSLLSFNNLSFIPKSDIFEVLWITIEMAGVIYALGCVYFPPNPEYRASNFIQYMSKCIEAINEHFPSCCIVVAGDFNTLDTCFLSCDFGLVQIVTTATHGNNILDKVFVSRTDLFCTFTIKSLIKTRHQAVVVKPCCTTELKTSSQDPNNISSASIVYDIREHNIDRLRYYLLTFDWSLLYACCYHFWVIDELYVMFLTAVKEAIHHCVPSKRVKMKVTDPEFITPLIKSLLNERNHLNRTGKVDAAARLAERLNCMIANVRSTHLAKLSNANAKELWAKVNPLTKSKAASKPSHVLTDPNEVNDYFCSFSYDASNSTKLCTLKREAHNNICSDSFQFFQAYEIEPLLRKVKKTSTGVDDLPHWLFSKCSVELADIVAFLFNVMLYYGVVPGNWHTAIVTPIPKVVKPKIIPDFRPISVTPILSRVLERLVVNKYLLPAIQTPDFFDQFGFKPTGSTNCALIYFMHEVTKMLETAQYVRCLMIDFAKAFDQVDHAILVEKLWNFKVPPFVVNWVIAFLENRNQITKLGKHYSNYKPINKGVVQGSALGPVLFLIMIHDMRTVSNFNKLFKYADDANVLSPANSDISLEEEFDHILQWAKINKMVINVSKTKEIVFRRPHPTNLCITNPIPNVAQVLEAKLLGVSFCSNLKFDVHVRNILSQCSQRTYMLKLLKAQGMPLNSLTVVFQALIVSRISYAISAWGGFLTADLTQRINAFLLRAVKYKVTNNTESFDDLLNKADRLLFQKMQKPQHCLNCILPEKRITGSNCNLRARGHELSLPRCHYNIFKNSYLPRCLFNFI